MVSPDAGTEVWLWNWWGLALGFALLAMGIPLSSPGLFGLLAHVMGQDFPWWVAGAVAGGATVLGHAASYLVFARFGQPILAALAARIPPLGLSVDRLRSLLADTRAWLAVLALRWVGLGYAQVFWVLATAGTRQPALLGLLFLNDVIWAFLWTYGAAGLLAGVPGARRWLAPGAAALVVLSFLGGAWAVYRWLARTARRP